MRETSVIEESRPPDGRRNRVEYDMETIQDGGATFYIKHRRTVLVRQVTDAEYTAYRTGTDLADAV